MNDLNYSEISSNFNLGKVDFNINYLEEQNHVGKENYVNAGLSLNLSANNKLSLETGSGEFFAPARKLFKKAGFKTCNPFASYKKTADSCYMGLLISN